MSAIFEQLRERLKDSDRSSLKCEEQFIKKIKKGVIGFNSKIQTVIGELCGVYADHTATARPFKSIEEHVMFDIKPLIANSHTETSATGNFSTQLNDYAEKSLLNSFKVSQKTHFAVPAGYGCTGAFERMINILDLSPTEKIPAVVFLTPYEHHSNILPWVEKGCKVIMLESDRFGNINYDAFQQQLDTHHKYPFQIVSISAASNVTSQKTDLSLVNSMVSSHKMRIPQGSKLIFAVDGAAYCSHGRLDLKQTLDQLDYLCLSPHKNLGGSESTGVLIGKRSSYDSLKAPSFPGGGTVLAVVGTDLKQIYYDSEPSHRESPGTPNTIGFYRAALSFQLQDFVTLQLIHD